ncbi:abortive infection protein [Butyrivibrio sp. XB500-5]|uniref:type IV toxin-antitoxin system AbiEi family antitoxin domain-containing protein n=1 Tax=Butyrivibrio sp. XB500-5 TaxID=2364880 RepID=UPI000EA8D824|nr:type IV toxin-antitoxin system AbiEi family antitoxin domain-containing protein [Butyrivibrio sp. XB500-5]RKM63315.1 abortive infection protein [Butyrivibrio sp. XB500-5]
MEISVELLKSLFELHDGVITAKELAEAGFTRTLLYICLLNGWLIKESHGRYVLADNQPDEFRMIQNRSEKLIFSHGTALYLHGLSDRVPHELDITVPQGDNVSRIKRDYDNTRFHYCKKEIWGLGITEATTPQGYTVKIYDHERCICDLIKDKKSVDTQIYSQAMREYFSGKCNPRKIVKYAREFNIEEKVRTYMEVL